MPSTKKRSNELRRLRYQSDPAYAAKMRARASQYQTDNASKIRKKCPEKGRRYRAANAEKLAAARRKYWADRPGLQLHYVRLRQARQIQATPTWVDIAAVRKIYRNAAELGVHVDHVVPLNSPLVCGLHWEGNLQIIPATDNMRKGNRWWPDMFYAPSIEVTATGS